MKSDIQIDTISLSADIKTIAVESAKKAKQSLSNYIEYLIIKDAEKHKYPEIDREPNEETIKAMKEALNTSASGIADIDLSSNENFLKSMGL